MRAETSTHSANCAHDRRDYSGAALGPVLDMPILVPRQVRSSWCQGRQHLCRGANAVSLGPVQKTIEILQLQFIDKVVVVCCARSSKFGCMQSVWRQSSSHSCSPLSMDTVVAMPVVVQRQMPGIIFVSSTSIITLDHKKKLKNNKFVGTPVTLKTGSTWLLRRLEGQGSRQHRPSEDLFVYPEVATPDTQTTRSTLLAQRAGTSSLRRSFRLSRCSLGDLLLQASKSSADKVFEWVFLTFPRFQKKVRSSAASAEMTRQVGISTLSACQLAPAGVVALMDAGGLMDLTAGKPPGIGAVQKYWSRGRPRVASGHCCLLSLWFCTS